MDSVFASNAATDLAYGSQTPASQNVETNSINSTQGTLALDHTTSSEKDMDSPSRLSDDQFSQFDK